MLTSSGKDLVEVESNESILKGMLQIICRETNVRTNYASLMALPGRVATVGLWTNMLHLVIGAAVIAPGFASILRVPFGLVGGARSGGGARRTHFLIY